MIRADLEVTLGVLEKPEREVQQPLFLYRRFALDIRAGIFLCGGSFHCLPSKRCTKALQNALMFIAP